MCVGSYDERASVSTPLLLCGEGTGQASSFRRCTHQVSKSEGREGGERASTVASLFAREPFPGHSPRFLAGEREGGREGKAEGGATEQEQCEKRGEGKWG